MSKSEKTVIKKLDPKAVYHAQGLNKDGSEKVDKTVISRPLRSGQMSADQKLKQMVEREIQRRTEEDETNLDAFDFEVPAEPSPIHSWVIIRPVGKREIVNELKRRSQNKPGKDPGGQAPKGPSGGPAEPVGKHKTKNSDTSARANADEVADEKED